MVWDGVWAGAAAVADRAAALRAAALVPQPQDPGAQRAHPRGLRLRLPRRRLGQAARGRDRQAAVRRRVRTPEQRPGRECSCRTNIIKPLLLWLRSLLPSTLKSLLSYIMVANI